MMKAMCKYNAVIFMVYLKISFSNFYFFITQATFSFLVWRFIHRKSFNDYNNTTYHTLGRERLRGKVWGTSACIIILWPVQLVSWHIQTQTRSIFAKHKLMLSPNVMDKYVNNQKRYAAQQTWYYDRFGNDWLHSLVGTLLLLGW